jgi:GNAT superfamily N-acetyltransferase
MTLDIQRLRADQWPLLRELRLAALRDAPAAFGQSIENALAQPDDEWISAARSASAGDRRAWFVALLDGRAVGLVQARRRLPHDCLVFSMWVAPRARRAGAGRALLEAVDTWAGRWGARRVVLWVIAGNDAAMRFYLDIGFEPLEAGEDAESGALYGALALDRPINLSGADRSAAGGTPGGDVG